MDDKIPQIPGLIFEKPDSRDALYGAFEDLLGSYPETFELDRLPFVRNQLQQFSCVLQSIARIEDYANRIESDNRRNSARYGFAYAKLWDGNPSLQGTFFKTGLDVAIKVGLATVEKWADDSTLPVEQYLARPSVDADASAQPFRSSGYVALNSPQEIKDYITKFKLPVLIGINSNNTGWGYTAVKNNNYVLREPTGSRTGHAVAVVGWNSTGWVFDNSWGESWGDRGRATVPYNYSGLQDTAYGLYDLPNLWQSINTNYQTEMGYAQINAIVYSLYRKFLGREPKPEEQAAIKGHVEKILAGLNQGGPAGQAVVDGAFAGFVPEIKQAVKENRI